MKINEIVKERRKSLGITQKDLAEKIGCNIARISDFERGKHAIGSDRLELIFEMLDVRVELD